MSFNRLDTHGTNNRAGKRQPLVVSLVAGSRQWDGRAQSLHILRVHWIPRGHWAEFLGSIVRVGCACRLCLIAVCSRRLTRPEQQLWDFISVTPGWSGEHTCGAARGTLAECWRAELDRGVARDLSSKCHGVRICVKTQVERSLVG